MAVYEIWPGANVSHAISSLVLGDTLLLHEGEYRQDRINVWVSGAEAEPIIIASFPGETAVLKAPPAERIIQIHGNYVTLANLDLDKESERHMVMRVYGEHVTVKDCHIHDCRWYTMILVAGHYCTFEDNVIHGNGDGPKRDAHGIVNRGNANFFSLIGNTMYDLAGDCFQSEEAVGNARNTRIIGNHLYTTWGWQSENAIDIKGSEGENEIRDNDIHGFRNCHYWPGAGDPNQDYPSGGAGAGIYIHRYAKNWTIENNHIHDNTMGIRFNDSRNVSFNMAILKNRILDIAHDDPNPHWPGAKCAIRISNDMRGVSITENIFDELQEEAIKLTGQTSPILIADNSYGGVLPTASPSPSPSPSASPSPSPSPSASPSPSPSEDAWKAPLQRQLDLLIVGVNTIKQWAEDYE